MHRNIADAPRSERWANAAKFEAVESFGRERTFVFGGGWRCGFGLLRKAGREREDKNADGELEHFHDANSSSGKRFNGLRQRVQNMDSSQNINFQEANARLFYFSIFLLTASHIIPVNRSIPSPLAAEIRAGAL
jgi:hypothetical protein